MSKSSTDVAARRGKIYGYIRVSTDMQAASGLSLRAQADAIRAAARLIAKRDRLAVSKVYRDPGVSAASRPLLGRPGGRSLNEALGDGDHVVIAKLDRAFRSTRDCLNTIETR